MYNILPDYATVRTIIIGIVIAIIAIVDAFYFNNSEDMP